MSTQQQADTKERTENSDDRDRLIHKICAAQADQLASLQPVVTRCGHRIVPQPVSGGGPHSLRCVVCEEMIRTNQCAHCDHTTKGGNQP